MNVWALSDFHLSFGVKNKSMEIFGDAWKNWTEKIQTHCHALIKQEDLLLIAGDISWASTLEEALPDLSWIDKLPGTKIILKGNHDYWWPSYSKLVKALPSSIKAVQNNSFVFKNICVGGTRLWDSPSFSFESLISSNQDSFGSSELKPFTLQDQVIYERELQRLEMSLNTFAKETVKKIVMTHYPPVGLDLASSTASKLFEKYQIDISVFGHLHSIKNKKPLFGQKGSILYALTSCDYLDFVPRQLL